MPTQVHKNNLKILAGFLENNYDKINFDMQFYRISDYCGTVACAAGHGPMAGIEKKTNEDWDQYVMRVFGCSGYLKNKNTMIWNFLFSPYLKLFDNTPLGAAARIRYFLDHEDTIDEYYDTRDTKIYQDYIIINHENISAEISLIT